LAFVLVWGVPVPQIKGNSLLPWSVHGKQRVV
jgi:hypothetical protein